MIDFIFLQEVWGSLEISQDTSKDQIEAHEIKQVKMSLGYPLLTVDANNYRHMLLPISTHTIRFINDRQSPGVHIITNEWGYEGEKQLYIDIICLKPHLNDVFNLMLVDILIDLSKDNTNPVQICQQVLNHWREFLIAEPSRLPDKSKLLGIWGELWILNQLSKLNSIAIQSWLGPSGGKYDFRNQTTALEIKSTLQRHGLSITINGHEQLEAPKDGALFLGVIKVEEQPLIGISIFDLIDQLVDIGVDRNKLLVCLLREGLSPESISQTQHLKFDVDKWLLYEVRKDFPRIISDSFKGNKLPNGVISVNYQIDLSSIPPHPIEESKKLEFLRQFVNEIS